MDFTGHKILLASPDYSMNKADYPATVKFKQKASQVLVTTVVQRSNIHDIYIAILVL